ncbi:MAG: ABC transporter permease [SAR202 cluster bacterium]|nr:ABC transporter permease [SAR202 cluster bacterium]MDP6300393.1 ABC transporter permease [SAR202 cluster bacterium]MDP7103153.1 ABC transporter permease [SAR202 cluster bacterium]MDP7224718.1 ABC transporter permease [SAR202 cluster bacterium]MDP7413988.1 ABC transporter permease [SAR202 cluster bacterium]
MVVKELTGELREQESRSHLARAWSRLIRKKIAVTCMVALVLVYSAGIFAPLISPYEYTAQDYAAVRKPPTGEHWAGTDLKGRDMLTRVLWGIQNTVVITVVSMASGSLVIGVTLGLVSGYFGKRIDAVIMRVGEVFSSFPDILLVIILAATLRPRILDWVRWLEDNTFLDGLVRSGIVDYTVIFLALVSFSWFGMARLVRGQVLSLKETQFIEAARALGSSTPRILFIHLLPNAISPIVVSVTMGMGAMIGTEIILSFLGLGIQPPRPSLGLMLQEAGSLSALRQVPWMLLTPGLVAWTLVLGWNLLGDALNDVLNPRTR